MPIVPGDIGAVATFMNDLFRYFTEPSGYADWSMERKLDALHIASVKAVMDRDFAAVDRLLGEYRRLQNTLI